MSGRDRRSGNGRGRRSGNGSGSKRDRSRSRSNRRRDDEPQFEPHDFRDSIKKIGKTVAEGYSFDSKTLVLISSFLNDILKNVTLKAKENADSKGQDTITYVDVMVAAMDQFGEENKWIERIVTQGQSKLEAFENRLKDNDQKAQARQNDDDDDWDSQDDEN